MFCIVFRNLQNLRIMISMGLCCGGGGGSGQTPKRGRSILLRRFCRPYKPPGLFLFFIFSTLLCKDQCTIEDSNLQLECVDIWAGDSNRPKNREAGELIKTHIHTHIHICMYVFIYVCMYVLSCILFYTRSV